MKVLTAINGDLATNLKKDDGIDLLEVGSLGEFDQFTDSQPVFALIDLNLAYATELMVRVKSEIDGPDRDRLPIFTVGAHKDNGEPHCIADVHFASRPTCDELVRAARKIIQRRARQKRLFDQEVVLEVPTTPENVLKAADFLEQFVRAAGYVEEEAIKLDNTIREAMGNAAEHGNKNDPGRLIHINFLRTSDRVAVIITDEGTGFDTEAFLKRAEEVSALEHTRSRRENEARPGGLGVFIMKETCDAIQFNKAGNSIYLMKYLPSGRS